jgi:DNA-directed RNA polymerase subunit RPC12/RpoP
MKQYENFEVSEVMCPRCGRAQPVHRRLLLVLPTGNKYEYRCAVCGAVVGGKDDGDASEYREILSRSGRIAG